MPHRPIKPNVNLEALLSGDLSKMTREEMYAGLTLLRTQTELLLEQIREEPYSVNENKELYDELELRHGGGFAQWVIDDLNRFNARKKSS